ncbi:MAG: hypothetical protein ACREH8_20110 [Opitutaceae bacterium]
MKNRFAKRRAILARRHVCTRCGVERPDNGRKWCVTCLAVEADKRDARTGADARRLRRIAHRRDCIRAALVKVQVRLEAGS